MLRTLAMGVMVVLAFGLGVAAERGGLLTTLADYREDIRFLAGQHLWLSLGAGGLAIISGIPLGIVLGRLTPARLAVPTLQLVNVGAAVPALALLALVAGLLGVGTAPALLVLWLAALLPIVRNTYTGLRELPESLRDIARGLGMRPLQILLRVELPAALPGVLAGVRTALTVSVGVASLVALIGGGGLGELIFTGIALNDTNLMLAGSIPAACLALGLDALMASLSVWLVPRGIRHQQRATMPP